MVTWKRSHVTELSIGSYCVLMGMEQMEVARSFLPTAPGVICMLMGGGDTLWMPLAVCPSG